MARMFFIALPAFFVFFIAYIVMGADKHAATVGLVIAAIMLKLGVDVTTPRKDRGEF